MATGSAGLPPDAGSLAGKLLRIDTLGRPAADNPDPASPIFSSGLRAPGGVCAEGSTIWITDRPGSRDVLYRADAGRARRPGLDVAGPARGRGVRGAARAAAGGADDARARCSCCGRTSNGTFTGAPETLLQNRYGRLSAAATAPDGLLWLGTTNKGSGGRVVPSDDRVIRIQPPAGGGESRQ